MKHFYSISLLLSQVYKNLFLIKIKYSKMNTIVLSIFVNQIHDCMCSVYKQESKASLHFENCKQNQLTLQNSTIIFPTNRRLRFLQL